MTSTETDQPITEHLDPTVWKIAAVVFLGPLLTQMSSTVVNLSLSTIGGELHASIDSAQWIISGYLLSLALALPLNAWLVDRLGARRLYIWCFSAFTVASLLCGMQKSVGKLILARVIQGIAGGLLTPMAQMMLARAAGRHLSRVIGYIAMPILIAPLLGPVVAGLILKYAGWPWLFYMNLPFGVLAVFLAMLLLPSDEAPDVPHPFDFSGFVLLSPGIACVLYGLDHAAHRGGRLLLILGAILIGSFIRHAVRKNTAALIDLRLFTNRSFSIGTVTQFLSNGATYGGQMLVSLFLITACGMSPAKAGWVLASMGIGMMLAYPSVGFLTHRLGCRAVSVAGTLLGILGTLPFLRAETTHLSSILLAVALFARGAGQAAVGVTSISVTYISVPREQLGLATTASNIVQRLGGPIGTTVVAIMLSPSTNDVQPFAGRPFIPAFAALIVLQLLLLCASARLPTQLHTASPQEGK